VLAAGAPQEVAARPVAVVLSSLLSLQRAPLTVVGCLVACQLAVVWIAGLVQAWVLQVLAAGAPQEVAARPVAVVLSSLLSLQRAPLTVVGCLVACQLEVERIAGLVLA